MLQASQLGRGKRVFLTRQIRWRFASLLIPLSSGSLLAQAQSETPHVHGPHGLEGWKLTAVIQSFESQGPLPVELVIARKGHIVRRITDGPFIWQWIFLPNGRQVAYETGPLHFSLTCVLVDIPSGKQLAAVDCWRGIPDDAPDWLELLEHAAATPPPKGR